MSSSVEQKSKLERNGCLLIINPERDFLSKSGKYARRHSGITEMLETRDHIEHTATAISEKLDIAAVRSQYRANQFGEGLSLCIPATEGV